MKSIGGGIPSAVEQEGVPWHQATPGEVLHGLGTYAPQERRQAL
jgi:hypothetical protein